MNQAYFEDQPTQNLDVAAASERVGVSSDSVAAPAPTQTNDATPSRHRFTMTVEDVAAKLHTYGLDRDERTIQRWCKSGKLDAIIDETDGDKWKVDPSSAQSVIDDILEAKSRRPTAFSPTSRQPDADVGDRPTVSEHVPTTEQSDPAEQSDMRRDTAATSPYVATTSAEHDDIVATLTERVTELETELMTAKADVQVREQMVKYQREEFTKWLNQTIDQAEQIGGLKKENEHLRAALPAASEVQPTLPLEQASPDVFEAAQEEAPRNPVSYEPSHPRYPQPGQWGSDV